MKKLYKILATIENSLAGILGFIGFILMSSISENWNLLILIKIIGITLLIFAYWELNEEE